jgi:predicted Zn-dependent peptidase
VQEPIWLIQRSMYQVTRLPNGLTVATAEMPHMASVSLGLWFAVGGRYEPAELNGISHFIEHMLFKGTRRRSARQISEAVEGLGGYLNAFTSEETTCLYARALHVHFEALLDVIMDMFLESRFDPADVEKERQVIKEELASYLDQPHQHAEELLNETVWPDQPLGRPLTGTPKTIDQLTRQQMLSYRGSNYVAAAALVAVAGCVRHAAVVRAARRCAARFPDGPPPCFAPADAGQTTPRVRLCTRDIAQTALILGIRTCSRHDPRRHALRVLNALLGESMSSRLFQALREDTGLAYSVHSSLTFFQDVGLLELEVGLDTDKLTRALRLIRRELDRLRCTAPSWRECRQAQDYLIGQLELSLESTENQMMWLAEHLLGYGRPVLAAEVKRSIAAVTPAQVRAVARDFFRPDRMNLVLVSPLKHTRGLLKLLAG